MYTSTCYLKVKKETLYSCQKNVDYPIIAKGLNNFPKFFSYLSINLVNKGGITYKHNFTLPSECSTVQIHFKMVLEAARSNLTLLAFQKLPTDISPTPQGSAWTPMFSSPYQIIFYETLYHTHYTTIY